MSVAVGPRWAGACRVSVAKPRFEPVSTLSPGVLDGRQDALHEVD